MSIYHFSAQIISKSQGRNAVACAAYRSGSTLVDDRTGEKKDYSHKSEVVFSEVQLCDNAPAEWQDRERLWNAVQDVETREDAQLAREIEVGLPIELSREQQIEVLQNYIKDNFVKKGMCADYSIHDKGDGNPHAHIMLTLRSVKSNGDFAPKSKQDYLLDENGQRIPVLDENGEQKLDSRNRKQWKRTTVPTNDWNEQSNVEIWRECWAKECNKYLAPENQIDHRSYARQGIEQEPTIHEGYAARQIEAKGGISEKCEYNRQVKQHNKLLKEIADYIKKGVDYVRYHSEWLKNIKDRLAELTSHRKPSFEDMLSNAHKRQAEQAEQSKWGKMIDQGREKNKAKPQNPTKKNELEL